MSLLNNENPFVGLRPFESEESLLFFGRQDQIVELLQRLHKHHFVAIVGSSGCGKSSLIRAGLIPKLKAGYLVNERDRWLIPVFKPGEAPLYNFASALLNELNDETYRITVDSLVQRIKEEGADGIIELFQKQFTDKRTNVFILVDQFEELFRFSMDSKDASKKDEAIDLVNILLELAGHEELPLYVVLTMRSDFIGDCTQFFGLPEALNKSQYLVPRLSRAQMKNAIEGPIRLFGSKINPSLTSRLLNDSRNVEDVLPLLQHVLMRTWDYEMKVNHNGELGLEDYIEIGCIEKALSQHADEALETMDNAEKRIAQLMFQALTTIDHSGRKIRRPTHLSELVNLTNASSEKINKIITKFNDDKRSFLIVNKSDDAADPLIDISHESLIRQWDTLIKWIGDETKSAKSYIRLCEEAKLNKEGKKDLLAGTELQIALKWREKYKPTSAWASRYNNDFEQAIIFLEESKEKERKDLKARRRLRVILGSISFLLLVAIMLSILAKVSEGEALMAKELALIEKSKADSSALVAKRKSIEADAYAKEAIQQGRLAEASALEALRQKELADVNADNARLSANLARENALEALKQKELADANAEMAQRQRNKAEESEYEAQKIAALNLIEKVKADSAAALNLEGLVKNQKAIMNLKDLVSKYEDPAIDSTIAALETSFVNRAVQFSSRNDEIFKGLQSKSYENLSGHIEMGDFNLGKNDFTIELWIKPVFDPSGENKFIITNRTDEGDQPGNWFSLALVKGKIVFEMAKDEFDQYVSIEGKTILKNDSWNFIAITRSSNDLTIYVNEEIDIQHEDIGVRNLTTNKNIGMIGGWAYWNTAFYQGIIDEVRVWHVSRTQEQIQSEMYNSVDVDARGLYNYYKFNEGAGNSVKDEKGINNGVIKNQVNWAIPNIPKYVGY